MFCLQVKQVNGKRVFKLTGYVEMAPRYFWDRLVEEFPLIIFSPHQCESDVFLLKVAAGGIVLQDRVCAELEPHAC